MKKYIILAVLPLLFGACKKDKKETPGAGTESNTKQTPTTNRRELTNDSLFLYAKQIYYWNSALPAYDTFEPRKYTSSGTDFTNYENNLYNIGKASGSPDYLPGEQYLKYSYIEDITTRNPDVQSYVPNEKASVDLEGNGNDIGIRPVIYSTSNSTNEYLLFITAVYPGSDAEKKGVKRGWSITKINGQAVGNDYNAESSILDAGLFANTVTLEGDKYVNKIKGETFKVTLNKTSYKSNPVYLSKVFTAGSKKIGYINYARFSNETNSLSLDTAFESFKSQRVTDLIVDLRYNGGGYVNTAEHLINLIAPSTATGVMYKEYFNTTLQTGKGEIMKNQPVLDDDEKVQYTNGRIVNYFDDVDYSVAGNTSSFNKAGDLDNLVNVVFIVSSSTASASELVINSLKPKMKVKLVGEKTYGKPVGFFPIRLENRYDVLMALFETKNSDDQGGYFSGIVPDYAENDNDIDFFDDPRYDFGDKSEPYTAKAISLLNPASAVVSAARSKGSVMSINGRQVAFNNGTVMKPLKKDNGEFIGMIETRHRLKKN